MKVNIDIILLSSKRTTTSNLKPQKKTTIYMALGIQVLSWDRHHNVAGLSWLM
jgi:hypothetical protein